MATTTTEPPRYASRSGVNHLQDVLDAICDAGFVCGRMSSVWDKAIGAYRASPATDPRADVQARWAHLGLSDPADWPPGADGSSVAMLFAAMYAGAGAAYSNDWGTDPQQTLLSDFFRPPGADREEWKIDPAWLPRWARPKTRPHYQHFPRRTSWPEIAESDGEPLEHDVSVILNNDHAVLLIRRRDGLVHPVTREPFRDHLVVAIDQNYRKRDHEGEARTAAERDFSGKPLIVEYLGQRAPTKSRSDKVSIVGIREPNPIHPYARLIVG